MTLKDLPKRVSPIKEKYNTLLTPSNYLHFLIHYSHEINLIIISSKKLNNYVIVNPTPHY